MQRNTVAVGLSRFPTVTETFILREVTEMERQGQPVRLVPLIRENPPVVHDAAKPWTKRALFTPFLSLPILGANLKAFAKHPARYVGVLARLIAGTLRAPRTLVATLGTFPKSVYLARVLESEGIRHIHVHYASMPATMALIVSKFAPITYSFTVHAFDIQGDRSILDWKIRESRFVRSISQFNKRFLEGLYPDDAKGKIHVVHVGIEPDVYTVNSARYAAVPGRVLCVAGHRPYKGLPYLIEACRILRDEGVAFECNLVGHGPMHDELARMIADRNLGDRVQLIGPRPEEEVARMMAEASLFVLPSIVDKDGMMEGIPVALMEAMATGRAVVSTTTAGIPELVDSGVSGLLVPPQDPPALAHAMRTLLQDPERARAMGERGREKVRAEFDLRQSATELLTLLDTENP
ncbi:MAG TPA: glycosyltransferase [Thermoanaerobaculia bacterium]|nr:glycosyltransferase [Thermoanaerobaculia bacterium]